MCKTAVPIEMQIGMLSRVSPWNHVLDAGAHCHYLANTTEPFICGNYAALCEISLTICFSTHSGQDRPSWNLW